MQLEVRVPALSDSVASGTLLPWRKAPGESVSRDETLVDLETDKVILEIPAPASGVLLEVRLPEGAVVKADQIIAVIDTEGIGVEGEETVAQAIKQAIAATHPVSTPTPATSPAPNPPAHAAAPAAQRVDPAPAQAALTQTLPARQTPQAGVSGSRREPMSRLRQRVAERLVAAQQNAALLTTFNEVNMAAVNELRQRMKAEFEIRHGVKLGYMAFFVRAVCEAMHEFPIVNAAIDGDDIVWHEDVEIGIAVSTPRGLVVPIVRRAQTLDAAGIERAIADFGARAKEGKLALEELAGGTFSITNGGVFGSLLSTPILNPPQSAILGMHAIADRPIAENGQVVIRPMMYLALTYDHRLIDGRDAVQFLVAVKRALEAPERLLAPV